jgi:hypothetical protein
MTSEEEGVEKLMGQRTVGEEGPVVPVDAVFQGQPLVVISRAVLEGDWW